MSKYRRWNENEIEIGCSAAQNVHIAFTYRNVRSHIKAIYFCAAIFVSVLCIRCYVQELQG